MDLGFKIQKTNLGGRIRILEILSVPILRQIGQIWIFWPKFGQKLIFSWNKSQHPRDAMYANFLTKGTTLTFLVQICPKRILKLEIDKTNVVIRTSILKISCVPIFSVKTDNFDLFGPNLSKKEIRIWNSEN